jgi:putative restriction endonuclease
MITPYIANTDRAWFDFLRSMAVNDVVDEVNFWLPKAITPLKRMSPGEPVFFRLKKPDYAIAGYGFFAHFALVDLHTAWSTFTWKNGDPDKRRFFERIGGYRGIDLLNQSAPISPVGCTILRDATFWPEHRWISWHESEGWANSIVQGTTERDPVRAARLLASIGADSHSVPDDLVAQFKLIEVDERTVALREVTNRDGQGVFRLRLLGAYDGQCAITGEHTEPVLDAAHIQPYLGPRSNHVQNGLLLTKEFHALYDAGYVTVTPDHKVLVSERLRTDWHNGKRYYPYDGKPIVHLPTNPSNRPSQEALAWHMKHRFKKAG